MLQDENNISSIEMNPKFNVISLALKYKILYKK